MHVGSDDRKVSAGESRPKAEGDVPTCANRDTEWACRRSEDETQGHESSLAPAPNSLVRYTQTHSKPTEKSKSIILVSRDMRD